VLAKRATPAGRSETDRERTLCTRGPEWSSDDAAEWSKDHHSSASRSDNEAIGEDLQPSLQVEYWPMTSRATREVQQRDRLVFPSQSTGVRSPKAVRTDCE